VIRNGGFEEGPVVWEQYSSGGYDVITDAWSDPYAGSWVAWFGGYNNALDRLTQLFHVPGNAQDSQTLTFYLYVETAELGGAYDHLLLRFLDVAGNPISDDIPLADNSSAPLPWTQQTVHLAGFSGVAGQDIQVQFEATTDGSLITNFVMDEVSLVFVCGQGVDAPAPANILVPRR
jgi:kumamolisin